MDDLLIESSKTSRSQKKTKCLHDRSVEMYTRVEDLEAAEFLKTHTLSCSSCKAAYLERYERLSSLKRLIPSMVPSAATEEQILEEAKLLMMAVDEQESVDTQLIEDRKEGLFYKEISRRVWEFIHPLQSLFK